MVDIYHIQHKIFDYVTFLTYFLYIIVALGISVSAPQYLETLLFYTKLYISFFLIYRFNPFRKTKFTPLDVKIAYNAGIFLLFTMAVNSVFNLYLSLFVRKINTII